MFGGMTVKPLKQCDATLAEKKKKKKLSMQMRQLKVRGIGDVLFTRSFICLLQ